MLTNNTFRSLRMTDRVNRVENDDEAWAREVPAKTAILQTLF
jgi:hypothetical protein